MTYTADTWRGHTVASVNDMNSSAAETVVALEFPDEAEAYLACCRRDGKGPAKPRADR
jgi:hypothetical protein